MIHTQPAEPVPARSVYNAALGGLIAAAIGAAIWGLIVWLTDYEVGIAAVGIGLLVGWAVHMASGRRKGRSLQIVAVLASVAGILVGKYVAVYLVLRDFVGDDLALTDPGIFELITSNPETFFSLFDLLWFALAIYTTWRFLAPETPQPATLGSPSDPTAPTAGSTEPPRSP